MYSAYKLNKEGDAIESWHTPFPIWNQSTVPCPALTVVSWLAYRFLRRQVMWSDTPISSRIFYSLLWSTQRLWHSQWSRNRFISGTTLLSPWPNKCWQFDLRFLCLFKTHLVHLSFSVPIVLKPSLKDFELRGWHQFREGFQKGLEKSP